MRRIAHSIAILDLDGEGQIIDTTARAEEADRRVQAKFAERNEATPAPDTGAYKSVFYGRDAFFDPSLLRLDQLNPGAEVAIAQLRRLYADIYILTSRPDFLARPTMMWLREHGIELDDEEVRFKLYKIGEEWREQRTFTSAWKSTIVYQAACSYRHVLFIDDDERNRQAVAALKMLNITIKDSLKDYIFDDSPIII
jgi:hypothetical protein